MRDFRIYNNLFTGPGAKNFEYTDNLDSNIASNASTLASMLDVSMFLMSNASQLLWMSREFPKIHTDNACVISKTNPGPCYRYIDGLNPKKPTSSGRHQGEQAEQPDANLSLLTN